MSPRLVAVLATLAVLALSPSPAAGGGEGKKRRNPDSVGEVPAGARVTLEFDKPEFFLGENVLAHFCVENVGKEPFSVNTGGDYRFAWRHLRFHVTATGEDGKPVADPHPSGFCEGGISTSPTVNPGEKFYASPPLIRYCRFEKPGVYTVRVSHDLGWEETATRKLPVAEAKLKLLMPDEKQARQVVETMFGMGEDPGGVGGRKSPPYPAFDALQYPVYLPILLARPCDEKVLLGIASIPTPEATQALIGLMKHPTLGLNAARFLCQRLPDPQLEGKLGRRNPFEDSMEPERRFLVERAWRAEFAPSVLAEAAKLLAAKEAERVNCGAFLLECLGGKDDLPSLIDALDQAVAQTKGMPLETRVYPRPRGACAELLRAATLLVRRGAPIPADPTSPGQAVLFLSALKERADFRPAGWEAKAAALLRHDIPYVRELAIEHLPRPMPTPLADLLPALLADPDLDVRIAACHAARDLRSPELREPILKVVASAEEHWLLNAATNAASALGARVETLELLVPRFDTTETGWQCFRTVMGWVIEHHGSGGKSALDGATADRLKVRWTKFLQDHKEALKARRRFKPGDPELTPDLMPPEYKIHLGEGKDWP